MQGASYSTFIYDVSRNLNALYNNKLYYTYKIKERVLQLRNILAIINFIIVLNFPARPLAAKDLTRGHAAAFLPLTKSIIVMTVNRTVVVRLVARPVTVIAVVAVNRWLVNLRMIVRDRCRGSYVIVSRQMRGSRSGHFRRVYYATLKTEETMRKWRAAINSQCSYVWLSFDVVKLFSNWLLQFPFKNRVKFIFESLRNFEHVSSTFNNNISLLLNVQNMKSTSRYKKRKEKWKTNFILLLIKNYNVISSTTRRSWSNYINLIISWIRF